MIANPSQREQSPKVISFDNLFRRSGIIFSMGETYAAGDLQSPAMEYQDL